MDKFKNKYRIPSARLQNWDYGNNGSYFITICTKNREHFFGEIINDEMQLNEMGILAEQYWMEIPTHFSFIELGNFVVMPNHVHGILITNKNETVETPKLGVCNDIPIAQTPNLGVSTTPTKQNTIGGKNENWKPATIGVIVNQYKRICTINIRKINSLFKWQPRFHDHIIRDANSFERIQNYIANNPLNWKEDKFYL